MSYEAGRTSYESRSREIAEALIAIEGQRLRLRSSRGSSRRCTATIGGFRSGRSSGRK
jgi:hypothetical protein